MELLVVIVILGILSGVVVFAVRGAGDKGEANAVATDDRIVRTAMEAFCAQYGSYPADMNELVTGPNGGAGGRGFLSAPSEYNSLPSVPVGSGCGGTGGNDPQSPKCDRLKLDGSGMEETVDAESGMWCLAASPNHSDSNLDYSLNRDYAKGVVQLRNGKVLAIREVISGLPAEKVLGVDTTVGYLTELFDPADGPKGKWSDGPVARVRLDKDGNIFDQLSNLTLIDGANKEECGDRCGHVFAHFGGHAKLYNPETNAWSVIEAQSLAGVGHAGVLQLTGNGCAPNCFKVLRVIRSGQRFAELYDPRTNQYELPFIWSLGGDDYLPTLAQMTDGRVMVRTTWYGGRIGNAYLINVKERNFETTKVAALGNYEDPPAVLRDGRLMYLYPTGPNGGEMYTPQEGSPGTWTVLKPRDTENSAGHTCAVNTGENCSILGTLPDGRVLVHRTQLFINDPNDPDDDTFGVTARLFDSMISDVNTQWSDTRFQPNRDAYGLGVLIDPRRGPCGTNCNSLLLVGNDSAELYKP